MCLSPIPWDGLWTSRHALCTEFAAMGHDVVFVDPPRNLLQRGPAHARRNRPERLRVAEPPPRLPYGVLDGIPGVARAVIAANAAVYARFVARQATSTDGPVMVLNSFMPVLGYLVADRLPDAVHVYHRADALEGFPTYKPYYSQLEARVLQQARVVLCVSPAVRASIADIRPDAVVLPNAVDSSRFADARPDPRLAALPRPKIALIGVVDDRTDAGLLEAAAKAGCLVVAGPVHIELPAGTKELGPIPPEEVPGVLAACDVALLCYRRDFAGDALKTYEYLAAGLPVVASDFAGLHSLRTHLTVVSTPSAMTAAVQAAAAGRTADGDRARRAVAAANSWRSRSEELLDMVGAAA